MNKRKIAPILVLLVILSAVGYAAGQRVEQPKHPPCTVDPCIEIRQDDGRKFKVNDFYFPRRGCIGFISLPDKRERSYCGPYKMEWIGPNTEAQII